MALSRRCGFGLRFLRHVRREWIGDEAQGGNYRTCIFFVSLHVQVPVLYCSWLCAAFNIITVTPFSKKKIVSISHASSSPRSHAAAPHHRWRRAPRSLHRLEEGAPLAPPPGGGRVARVVTWSLEEGASPAGSTSRRSRRPRRHWRRARASPAGSTWRRSRRPRGRLEDVSPTRCGRAAVVLP
ncbi:hypothetical protein BS78_01G289200 [Paspalum vaginatum]|nr:hypothetical protein BS78_01G289200 [Paspalum vaginatum]